MTKSKLTLIIDGNWLLMSRLSVINNHFESDIEMNHQLKLMLIKSINITLRTFKEIDNIIFVADGGSWRNKIEIPSCLHHDEIGKDVEYKGTRTKSENINWDMLFEGYENLISIMNSIGITTCKEKDIEGDDWCNYWSKKLNSEGTNCIIWSKDKDLQQLVKMDSNECFTVWWNKDSGIVCEEYDESQLDFLFNMDFSQNDIIFKHICDKASKVTTIIPKNIIIEKIFKGDISDNIFPIALRNSKTNNGKKFKISSKDIPYNIDIENLSEVKTFLSELFENKSYKGRINETIEECLEHFTYNKYLVWLDKKMYPKEIIDILNRYKTYNINKDLSLAESKLTAQANNIKGILDNI